MKPTILLVDDDPAVLHVWAPVLAGQEYRVVTARTAPKALSILKTGRIDLLICGNDGQGQLNEELLVQAEEDFASIPRLQISDLAPSLNTGADLPRLLEPILATTAA